MNETTRIRMFVCSWVDRCLCVCLRQAKNGSNDKLAYLRVNRVCAGAAAAAVACTTGKTTPKNKFFSFYFYLMFETQAAHQLATTCTCKS